MVEEQARLTPRQAAVLGFIREYVAAHAHPPRWEDIKRHFGWASNNAVTIHLRPMRAKGWIAWDETSTGRMMGRSLRITGGEACPCCGGTGRRNEDGGQGS